jgi:hypothetical protein
MKWKTELLIKAYFIQKVYPEKGISGGKTVERIS